MRTKNFDIKIKVRTSFNMYLTRMLMILPVYSINKFGTSENLISVEYKGVNVHSGPIGVTILFG